MYRRIYPFLLPTMLCLPVLADEPKPETTAESIRSRTDAFLTASVENGVSGAIMVARRGDLIIEKGFGFADRENRTPIDSQTVFDIGSVTKQFTGAAILKLVQQEKLKTTDTIDRFFDGVPPDKERITVHQLLTHTSGLVDSFGDGDFDLIPEDEFFKTLFSSQLLSEPGTEHRYSNSGYSMLAKIIEKLSGKDYESFLNEQLFQPAGMRKTGYRLPQWDDGRLAQGYQRGVVERGTTLQRYRDDGRVSWNLKGNGGLNSTHEDMFKWYQAMKSERILPNALMKRWTQPHVAEQADGESHYGYGWAIFESPRGTKIVSHNGGNGVFFHDFLWLPEEDVVILFSSNSYSPKIENVAWKIEKIVFDPSYRPDAVPRNPYFLIADFIKNHEPNESPELLRLIERSEGDDFESPEVLNRSGYIVLRSGDNVKWAVELFKLNTRMFPDDGNVWDSLGDGYLAAGEADQAILAFREAVERNNSESSVKLERLIEATAEKR